MNSRRLVWINQYPFQSICSFKFRKIVSVVIQFDCGRKQLFIVWIASDLWIRRSWRVWIFYLMLISISMIYWWIAVSGLWFSFILEWFCFCENGDVWKEIGGLVNYGVAECQCSYWSLIPLFNDTSHPPRNKNSFDHPMSDDWMNYLRHVDSCNK